MALSYTKTSFEIREITLRDRPQELYNASQKGTVPVLITNQNIVIDESLDIMIWALSNNKSQTWLTDNKKQELEHIAINDTTFKKWLDRYKYHDRYPEKSKEYYREKCSAILDEHENQLEKTKYLSSDKKGIVDIAIFPFVRQFANTDYKWFESNYNFLEKWLKDIVNSKLFLSIMDKYPTWDTKNPSKIIKFDN